MDEGTSSQNVKIWIGNLDTKVTEYQLLKIVEKFGQISSYDFLYNINDRGARSPRGYAFVTFENAKNAADAIKNLHKKKILSREILVRYATAKSDPTQRISDKLIPAALKAGSKRELSESEKLKKIRELEAKLKVMESSKEEFKVKAGPRTKPY